MNFGFDGMTTEVPGTASGLGYEVAMRLAAGGERVVGFGVDSIRIPDISPLVDIFGVFIAVGNPGEIGAAVASLDGPVDLLHNVAGLPQTGPDIDADGRWSAVTSTSQHDQVVAA